MKFVSFIKEKFNGISIQLVLLILIIIAMVQFVTVSFIIMDLLEKLNIDENIEIIRLFMAKIILLNISMILLFIFIVLLVRKIFEKLHKYAFYSYTTGLPNKNYMINNLFDKLSNSNEFSALINLDMDDFKAVNDTLGHLSGDELLKQAGERFEKIIKEQDCVCHIGGDEFLFFIKSADNIADIEKIAKDIIRTFSKPFIINGNAIDYVTASIGIALLPQDGSDFQTLYNCADDAMYSAKKFGKNSYKFYNKGMSLNLYEESVKKKEIKEGIKNKEFKVFYQPKFSKDGVLIGAEALARWIKKDGQILPPSEFIVIAENNGLIVPLTDIIIDEVCEKVLYWEKSGYEKFTISINITSEHIMNERLCKNMIKRIKSFNVSPQYLEFEITESMIIKEFDIAINNIRMIREFGIKISMDDFGTGYSSLNYLKKLPIDIIKIDKSFVETINRDEKDKVLLENIINLSHGFQFDVIAEGVETEQQYETLKKMKCDMFQGYYFGKPVADTNFETLFLKKVEYRLE
ncbi:MAG: putative bifunctional diguanylate cyclase/phosphodiesterase [Sedimentibacter sp.]